MPQFYQWCINFSQKLYILTWINHKTVITFWLRCTLCSSTFNHLHVTFKRNVYAAFHDFFFQLDLAANFKMMLLIDFLPIFFSIYMWSYNAKIIYWKLIIIVIIWLEYDDMNIFKNVFTNTSRSLVSSILSEYFCFRLLDTSFM